MQRVLMSEPLSPVVNQSDSRWWLWSKNNLTQAALAEVKGLQRGGTVCEVMATGSS